MPELNYSETIVALTNEDVGQLNTSLSEIRSVVNALDNDNIANSAGIDYSKLDLGGSVRNSDVKSDAAISFSKLADLNVGQFLVGNGSNPTAAVMGGAATVDAFGDLTMAGGVSVTIADINIAGDSTTMTNLINHSLPAGKFLHIGAVHFGAGTTPGFIGVKADIVRLFGGTVGESSRSVLPNSTTDELVVLGVSDDTDGAYYLRAVVTASGGGTPEVGAGVIFASIPVGNDGNV